MYKGLSDVKRQLLRGVNQESEKKGQMVPPLIAVKTFPIDNFSIEWFGGEWITQLILFPRARKLIVNFCSAVSRLKSRRNLRICCVTFDISCPSFSHTQEYAISNTYSASKYNEDDVWESGMNKVYDERMQYFRYLRNRTISIDFRKLTLQIFTRENKFS